VRLCLLLAHFGHGPSLLQRLVETHGFLHCASYRVGSGSGIFRKLAVSCIPAG